MPTKASDQNKSIAPANGWGVQSSFGFQRSAAAAGQSVDLVRLSDLVRWLQDSKTISLSEAVEALCDALPADVMQWLYELKPTDRPNLVKPDCWFGFQSNGKVLTSSDPEAGRGALLWTLRKWASVREWDSRRDLRSYLAIPHEQAQAHWGWGSVAKVVPLHVVSGEDAEPVTYTGLLEFRNKHSKSEWTTSQKSIAATEKKRRISIPGAKGVADAMAKELGISVSRFNDLIRNLANVGKRESARTKSA